MRLRRRGAIAGSVAAAAIIGAVAVLSAAKPTPPTPTAADVTFRCYSGDATNTRCDDPLDGGGNLVTPTDRARDDSQTYTTGTIGSNGMYLIRLMPGTPTPRWLNLYLYKQAMFTGSRTCGGNCNPDGPPWERPVAQYDIELRTKPLVAGTWDDLPGGLFAMSCGAPAYPGPPYPGMVHFTFWLPSGNGHWGLNFNPRSASGSSPVSIVRTGLKQWTVEAKETATESSPSRSDVGGLLSWGHSGLRGKNGPSVEGLFSVPFLFTIDATGAVPLNGTCS